MRTRGWRWLIFSTLSAPGTPGDRGPQATGDRAFARPQAYAEGMEPRCHPVVRRAGRSPRPVVSVRPQAWCTDPGQSHAWGEWETFERVGLNGSGQLFRPQRRLCWRCGQPQGREQRLETVGDRGWLVLHGPAEQYRLLGRLV